MKTIYFECNMGAAGDMLMSALAELYGSADEAAALLNGIGIPNVKYEVRTSVKCGITGTHTDVFVNGATEHEHMHDDHHDHHHHHHAGMRDIEEIISSLTLPDKVRTDAINVYRLIAEAESRAHGREITDIHFHEVGTMDAVADVVGVHCAHGILPVPAPATAYILRDVPIYSGSVTGELCTPTGAALLKYFASDFCPMPVMRVSSIGYGMGTKDFDAANCVRAILGETEGGRDKVTELCCNIDDMTGEAVGFAVRALMEAGALDVFTTPIGMKKNRPGILLSCICREEDRDNMLRLIFKHTTTIGVREHISNRYVLQRRDTAITTPYGDVRIKTSSGYGVTRSKAEYDDLEKIARENDLALSDIKIQ